MVLSLYANFTTDSKMSFYSWFTKIRILSFKLELLSLPHTHFSPMPLTYRRDQVNCPVECPTFYHLASSWFHLICSSILHISYSLEMKAKGLITFRVWGLHHMSGDLCYLWIHHLKTMCMSQAHWLVEFNRVTRNELVFVNIHKSFFWGHSVSPKMNFPISWLGLYSWLLS